MTCGCIKATALSNSVMSMNWPRPDRWRSMTAMSRAMAVYRPVPMSTMAMPRRVGPDSGSPLTLNMPLIACTMAS